MIEGLNVHYLWIIYTKIYTCKNQWTLSLSYKVHKLIMFPFIHSIIFVDMISL